MLPEQSTQEHSQLFLLQSLRGQLLCHSSGCTGSVSDPKHECHPPYRSQFGPA